MPSTIYVQSVRTANSRTTLTSMAARASTYISPQFHRGREDVLVACHGEEHNSQLSLDSLLGAFVFHAANLVASWAPDNPAPSVHAFHTHSTPVTPVLEVREGHQEGVIAQVAEEAWPMRPARAPPLVHSRYVRSVAARKELRVLGLF
ncbi:hypothetical protein CYMTET_54678 [Cymbomonas tetramitiformis]|uniref:Uncharacterized protein n=1 Tax=Cymbomonas tetramitiformis TaxID=36881 RepID=A0AAE0BEQ1_9CHLO|nr:hypothetical protein CYMTET_54678 [Cymbomonas tetramitiformis]